MSNSQRPLRRLLLTIALVSAAAGIATIVIMGQSRETSAPATATTPAAPEQAAQQAAAATPSAAGAPAAAPAAAKQPEGPAWTAAAPGGPSTAATPIGSVDSSVAAFRVDLTPRGAGIGRIVLSDVWKTAADKARARAGDPPAEGRYEIAPPGRLQGYDVPLLAVYGIEVDGQLVRVDGDVWRETAPGTFVTEILDGAGALQLRATRTWSLDGTSNEIRCAQRVENLSASQRTVKWMQYGPTELSRDPNDSIDSRRFQSGYLMSRERDPGQSTVIVHDATLDQSALVKEAQAAAEGFVRVWPSERQLQEGYRLSWFGATNRYFALAVHAPYAPPAGSKAIAPAIAAVQALVGQGSHLGQPQDVIFTTSTSEPVAVQPGSSASFDVGVFAGPLERSILAGTEPFAALNMQGLILYLMSGCCSWCTFSWLADTLVWFLAFLHDRVVFDWGLAIVVLVVVVRGLLHPLTRRSQISMMRVTKQMASIKPEIDALQKRYKDDPKKLQEETIRLYRERGVNPLGCAGGMLPTFLQMPIWMALYAVLYFAFELRQQPAFFGIFQQFGGWGFLGDLSGQDRFVPLPFSLNLYIMRLEAVNLLPLLMGLVFWLQQKYMAPPPTANMSPEAEQQQKMMKWMMIIVFPLTLYSAPSGLTLYIATSTLVGIYESKRVRREIETMDLTARPAGKGWMAAVLERAQQAQRKAQERSKAPSRRFRDR
jgi:YidC/Oxa1 family membrane protein insertase